MEITSILRQWLSTQIELMDFNEGFWDYHWGRKGASGGGNGICFSKWFIFI